MKRVLKIAFLGLGVWLCVVMLRRVDFHELSSNLQLMGAWAPTVLAPYLLVYFIDTAAWRVCFGRLGINRVGFSTLLRIRWCGESLNSVIPSAYIGGEALKVFLLSKQGVPAERSTAAAVISKTVQTLAQFIVLAAVSISFLQLVSEDSPLRRGLLAVIVGSLGVVIGLFWIQQRGIFGTLAGMMERLGIKSLTLERSRKRWERVDQTIADFYRNERPHFFKGVGIYCVGWVADGLEIWWFARLIEHPITWIQAMSVEAVVGVAKIVGLFMPGALGIQESGIVLVGRAAGLPDSLCVAYAVIRRVREILFALAGSGLFVLEKEKGPTSAVTPPGTLNAKLQW